MVVRRTYQIRIFDRPRRLLFFQWWWCFNIMFIWNTPSYLFVSSLFLVSGIIFCFLLVYVIATVVIVATGRVRISSFSLGLVQRTGIRVDVNSFAIFMVVYGMIIRKLAGQNTV